MIDLTGANLYSYLIRIVKDAVNRNPRFKNTLGDVSFATSNQINFGDAQVIIKDLSTEGTRLSFDYFMCTQLGHALVAKVGDKEGKFIEWASEIDKTHATPIAGVYYINIDAVDEQTRDVDITIQQFKWKSGKLTNAVGSIVYLAPQWDGTKLVAYEAGSPPTPLTSDQSPPQTTYPFEHFIYLLTPTNYLVLVNPGSPPVTLEPLIDYWYQRVQSFVLIQSTKGGAELTNIPVLYISVDIVDQSGYVLRPNIDYVWNGPQWIQLSDQTPPGSTITANCVVKLDPSKTIGTNPENIIPLDLLPGEVLASEQVMITTNSGTYNNVPVTIAGSPPVGIVTLPVLMMPGDYVMYDVRIDAGLQTARGKKYELNGFHLTNPDPMVPNKLCITKDPVTGQPIDAIPGLWIAVGDSVVVGDQAAIIVSPYFTETYEVFGSKENLSFTMDFKANDLQTASDFSELLKQELLIWRRENMEHDGVTIFEARRTNKAAARDASATAPTYTFSLNVSASADWKVFRPKINRVAAIEITNTAYSGDYLGKLQVQPRMQAFGMFTFLPDYR